MKKLIPRLSSIVLLVFSFLFGVLTISTPVFADEISNNALDTLLGTLPSDNSNTTGDYLDNLLGLDDDNDTNTTGSDLDNLLGIDDDDSPLDDLLGIDDDEDDSLDNLLGDDDDDLDNLLGIDDDDEENNNSSTVNTCQDESKGASWILCTAFELVTSASDTVYGLVEDLLAVEPLSTETDSAVYKVWDYMRGFTNIIFVIFLIIVIYSQITGLGINNYGIKRILPRLIIAIILVNLSYIICAILVDASNIVGSGISGIFEKIITDTGLNDIAENSLFAVDWSTIYLAFTGSAAALALFTVSAGGLGAAFWAAIFLIIGVLFSILSGLITIGLRQVVVTLLVTISPLAFVAYLLPNTEKWFNKWKSLLAQMIFFYPIFAILFYTSKLAGLTIIGNSEGNIFKVIVGLAVQVLPLFLSISLLKMSGTILGKVSSGLDKAFGYATKPLQNWAMSHREQNKQRYLAQNIAPGARLRNFLARRQALREMNTLDNQEIVTNRAAETALNKRASYLGVDKDGKPIWGTKLGPVTWRNHANSYTRAAARSHVQKLSTTGAQARLANSLSDHGSLFSSDHSPYGYLAKRLSKRSVNAFEEMAVQEFWKENIAQADQEYLINRYLGAIDQSKPNAAYDYNRLITSAAGGLGYKGEKTIIGQVVKRSADLEARRRAEAAIVINKFGYNKEFRNMMFDRRYMNDDGFALDADGNPVEDMNYRPLEGKTVERWNKYIYVDEHNKRIDRAKGDKMSPEQLKAKGIRKVRYSDIYDDKGNAVSHIYEDDAGYVKEMITNDMLIGDPIALRYATEIGLMRSDSDLANDPLSAQYAEKNRENGTGMIRRYRTSVVGALQSTGFKEHMAEMTSLLLAQINAGHINSPEQMNLARIMSFVRSSKVGAFLQNDSFFYKFWSRILPSINDPEKFAEFFPDSEIALYRDQNGLPLDGLRLAIDQDGNQYWKDISHTSSDITIDDKRNYILHKAIPKAAAKIIGALDRKVSPSTYDNMKPENMGHLLDALLAAGTVGINNSDPSIPFEKRANGTMNLFDSGDPNLFKQNVEELRRQSEARKAGINPKTINAQEKFLHDFKKRLRHNNPVQASRDVEEILLNDAFGLDSTYGLLQAYCHQNPVLNVFSSEIDEMIERYMYGGEIGDDEAEVAHNLASNNYTREQFLEEFRSRFF